MRVIVMFFIAAALCTGCASNKSSDSRARKKASTPRYMTESWEQVRRNPARVEVLGMRAVPLKAGTGKDSWLRVPDQFVEHDTQIFMPQEQVNGVADYKVMSGGFLLVACNYDYQGNVSGNWTAQRWTKAQFQKNGWREVSPEQMGGHLVKDGNRAQVVFVKKAKFGETGRLRCNKYDPPFFIVFGGGR